VLLAHDDDDDDVVVIVVVAVLSCRLRHCLGTTPLPVTADLGRWWRGSRGRERKVIALV